MKRFKIIFLLSAVMISGACSLDEEPPFLDESVYNSTESIQAALNGIYQGLTTYNAQERKYFVTAAFSGLFITKRGGNNINNAWNTSLVALKPGYDVDSNGLWQGFYSAIARCNSAISSVNTFDSPLTSEELLFNDVAGHAYFVRAHTYFNLVSLWGEVPLWTELPSSNSVSKAKSTEKEVYDQIIRDAKAASGLLNGAAGEGYPLVHAANMLLAKVYMTLATADASLRDPLLTDADYWQLAYDEAIKVYGQYSLVSDYASLFTVGGENSSESIFELQISTLASNSQMGRNYTPSGYKGTQAFGWLHVNADVYDQHVAAYGAGDPRIAGTYISEFTPANGGNNVTTYPVNQSRGNVQNANVYFFKHAEKDQSSTSQYDSKNLIVYRYADLLLMLAEISNELQNGEQLGYVSEVLGRVGLSPHADYALGQTSFRDAIMKEYRFELIGEGEDSHNNRRRGYDYFLNTTILAHNNAIAPESTVDVVLNTTETEVMKLLIPLIEINTNELIDE